METTSHDYLSCGAILAAASGLVKTVHDFISDWLPTQDSNATVATSDYLTDWN